MRILRDGFKEYHDDLHDVWLDGDHHNGWVRIELRITTDHAADWGELQLGYVEISRMFKTTACVNIWLFFKDLSALNF